MLLKQYIFVTGLYCMLLLLFCVFLQLFLFNYTKSLIRTPPRIFPGVSLKYHSHLHFLFFCSNRLWGANFLLQFTEFCSALVAAAGHKQNGDHLQWNKSVTTWSFKKKNTQRKSPPVAYAQSKKKNVLKYII